MASPNVETVLKTLHENGVLVAELHLVFAKIEQASGVDLTKGEKIEFLNEIAKLAPLEPGVAFIW